MRLIKILVHVLVDELKHKSHPKLDVITPVFPFVHLTLVCIFVPSEGPDQWQDVNPDCGRRRQSPINIVTKKTLLDERLTPFKFTGYEHAFKPTLKNNGHSGKDSSYVCFPWICVEFFCYTICVCTCCVTPRHWKLQSSHHNILTLVERQI